MDEPERPGGRHIERSVTDTLQVSDEIQREVRRTFIAIDRRLVAVLVVLILIGPAIELASGDVGAALLGLVLGVVATVVGYFAVTKQELTDRA